MVGVCCIVETTSRSIFLLKRDAEYRPWEFFACNTKHGYLAEQAEHDMLCSCASSELHEYKLTLENPETVILPEKFSNTILMVCASWNAKKPSLILGTGHGCPSVGTTHLKHVTMKPFNLVSKLANIIACKDHLRHEKEKRTNHLYFRVALHNILKKTYTNVIKYVWKPKCAVLDTLKWSCHNPFNKACWFDSRQALEWIARTTMLSECRLPHGKTKVL